MVEFRVEVKSKSLFWGSGVTGYIVRLVDTWLLYRSLFVLNYGSYNLFDYILILYCEQRQVYTFLYHIWSLQAQQNVVILIALMWSYYSVCSTLFRERMTNYVVTPSGHRQISSTRVIPALTLLNPVLLSVDCGAKWPRLPTGNYCRCHCAGIFIIRNISRNWKNTVVGITDWMLQEHKTSR